MTANTNYDVIISTCGKFSDLWDAQVLLMNQHWQPRGNQTFLVTDDPTDASFDGVQVVSAGAGKEITERLAVALESVTSKYIVFTLDDYFLTAPIDNSKIVRAIEFMESENIDYVRLYSATKKYLKQEGAVPFEQHEGFFLRNLEKGTYKISLYPGIWRTDFMRQTVSEVMNAWQYEVALTDMARRLNARCAISNNNEFPFLDVVRKGKILPKAADYFKQNPIYHGDREVMGMKQWRKMATIVWIRQALPKPLFTLVKKIMIKRGMTFYSPVEEEST